MSKITFGYHIDNVSILDKSSCDNIEKMLDILRDIKKVEGVGLKAWNSIHAGLFPAFRIQIAADYGTLKSVLEKIVESQGMPAFVDQPSAIPRLSKFIIGKLGSKVYKNMPTTHDAYDLMKAKYAEKNVRLTHLADDTLAIDLGYI
jgi:hypothetical protein